APFVLAVHPTVQAKSLQELLALAKAKPGQLSYATPGTGSSPHLAGELLKMLSGVDILHVPYKGMVPAATDVMGGNVPILFGNSLVVLPAIRNGKLRGIAITTLRRSSVAPDLPTIAESGFPGYESGTWYGLMAPARTAREAACPGGRSRHHDAGADGRFRAERDREVGQGREGGGYQG